MSLLGKDPIYDIAEINIDNLPTSRALGLVEHLTQLGYDVTTKLKSFESSGGETYDVYGRKRYVVNNDPAETKLFNKFIDTFQKAVDLLSKGNGVCIEINHSVGAIDIDIQPKNLKKE